MQKNFILYKANFFKIRTKVIRTHTRDLSANSNINANNTTTRRINYQNNEKKETTIDKTNKLMKIYNPIPPQQIPKKKMSSYHINSKKEKVLIFLHNY